MGEFAWHGYPALTRSELQSAVPPGTIAGFESFTDNLSMPPALPSIYAYTDFRAYLGDSYQARKASERKYSHRFIADKVKASSSGWFSDIVEDRLNLAGAQLLPLAGLLRLNIQFFPLSQ